MVDRDDVRIISSGAAVTVHAKCLDYHNFVWSSSSKVGEAKQQMFLINIIMAVFIVLCGLDISQVCNCVFFKFRK